MERFLSALYGLCVAVPICWNGLYMLGFLHFNMAFAGFLSGSHGDLAEISLTASHMMIIGVSVYTSAAFTIPIKLSLLIANSIMLIELIMIFRNFDMNLDIKLNGIKLTAIITHGIMLVFMPFGRIDLVCYVRMLSTVGMMTLFGNKRVRLALVYWYMFCMTRSLKLL